MRSLTPSNEDQSARIPLGKETFRFACHAGVPCFTRCCHDIRIELRPYDIVRLKASLGIPTGLILEKYTYTIVEDNPNFPLVRLAMSTGPDAPCPFLSTHGCTVYDNRPDACRTYPLERGVSLEAGKLETLRESYFLSRQPMCLGHEEEQEWTVAEWIRNQGVQEYNKMNNLWADLEILFRASPGLWGIEGMESQSFRMAFTASYDMDRFREFVFNSSFLKRYRVKPDLVRRLRKDDTALLRFGHVWVKFHVFHIPTKTILLRKH